MRPYRLCFILCFALGALAGPLARAPRYSGWGPATNAGAPVNGAGQDFPMALSKDGLSLYFQRGSGAAEDLWVARRESVDAPWGEPRRLPDTVNSEFNDRGARLSPDGHWLFFGSDRPGGAGGVDIWVCWRENIHDDFAWLPAVNLGSPVNSAGFDSGPSLVEQADDAVLQLYFTSGRPGGPGATDIYMTVGHPTGFFGVPELVPELSSVSRDEGPYVRHDNLEIFMQSNRDRGQFDVWVSRRDTPLDAWSVPEKAAGVNTDEWQELTPVISWDRRTIFFGSNRPGAALADIFVASRAKLTGGQ